MSEVIVRLVGGLGNQLFQYATARAVALRNDAELLIDASWFSSSLDRSYALTPFCINARVLESVPAHTVSKGFLQRAIQRYGFRLGVHKFGKPVFTEKSFYFDPTVTKLCAPIYLDGYFQSEKYFSDFKQVILDDLQLRNPPRTETQIMLDRIKETDSIGVHIRRGDYITNPNANAYHGVCSMDYYRRGLEVVAKNLFRPHCFVFSDDPVWVHKNLKFDLPFTLIDIHGLDEAHEDLRLMSACHSYVIANSSLSWWGAWLGHRKGKQVVAPEKWFLKGNINTNDLLPNAWVKV